MMTTTCLAVILPSRGLVFSQTVESLINNLLEVRMKKKVFITHDKPCPDAQEYATEQAIEWMYEVGSAEGSAILYLEEDMVLPKDTTLRDILKDFNRDNIGVWAFDYALKGGQATAIYSGKKLFACGLGATVIRASIIEEMPRPWFRTDMKFDLRSKRWIYSKPQPDDYGLFDVFFTYQAIKRSDAVRVSRKVATHLEVIEHGNKNTNNGHHKIGVKGEISHHIDINKE